MMSFMQELLSNPTLLFNLIQDFIDRHQLEDQLPLVLPEGWQLVDHDYCKTSITSAATTSVVECRNGSSVESEDSIGSDRDMTLLTSPSPPPSELRITEEDSDTSTSNSISSPEPRSSVSSNDDSPCSLTSSVEGDEDDDEVVFICEGVFSVPPDYRKGMVDECRVAEKAWCPSDYDDGSDCSINGAPSPSFSEASTLCSDDSGSPFEEIDLTSPPRPSPPPSPHPSPKTSDESDQISGKRKTEVQPFDSNIPAKRIRKPKSRCTHSNWRREISMYKKCVALRKSKIESNGVYSTSFIPSGVCVMEYVGQRIPSKLAEERGRYYVSIGIVHDYMFRVDEEVTIDATRPFRIYSLAKFVNHSCEPNTRSSIMVIKDEPRVLIVAIRDIEPGEELSMDYCLSEEPDPAKRVRCLCGSANCRGFIN